MKKIEKLTKKQEAALPNYVNKWLDIGLSTKRIDKEKCNIAVDNFYRSIGFEAPKFKIYVQSPLEAAIAGVILKNMLDGQKLDQVRSQVRSQVESQVYSQVESQVRSQVESQVRSQVYSQVESQVESQVYSQVGSQVGSQVRSQVGSQVYSQVESQVGNLMYIGFWSGYYSFYDALSDVVDVSLMFPCMELSKHCSCINAYKDYVIISERPTKICFDEEKRLHSENYGAIEFANGEKYYYWRGVSVPDNWIADKKALSAKEAVSQVNLDLRKAACEIVGWSNILKELKSKTIDKNKDPQIGELLEIDMPDVGKMRLLRVKCGTGREFALVVDPKCKTAIEANAYTYFLDPEELKIEVRT